MSATLVTGASGMVGGWLVRALLARGERVVALQRHAGAPAGAGCTVVTGEITDEALLSRAVAEHGVGTVFHLAAQSIAGEASAAPAATFATNVAGTWALLEAARRGGVERVVVAASVQAYGPAATAPYTEDTALRPALPYDASKAAADLIARSYWTAYGLPVATTRFTNVYGGGDRQRSRLIPELVAAALAGRPAAIRSDGTPARDFLYVEDAVDAYLAIADALGAADGGARGEAFNAGGGRAVSVREVVETLGRVAGAPLDVRYAPPDRGRPEPPGQYVDISKIRRVCGWQPRVELEEGLRRTLAWYRDG